MFTYAYVTEQSIGPNAADAAIKGLYEDLGNGTVPEISRITMSLDRRNHLTKVTIVFQLHF